jgi:PAS domain S-box-containing protein
MPSRDVAGLISLASLGIEETDAPAKGAEDSHSGQRLILDAIPFPVAVVRRSDEVVLYVNTPLARMADQDAAFMKGRRSTVKYASRDDYEEVQALLDRDGRADEREVRLRNAAGRIFWVTLSAVRIPYHGDDAMLVGFTDITARKQAEVVQRELIDAVPIPLVLARTSDATILQINRRASELFGIAADVAVGRHATDFYLVEEERRRLGALLRQDGQVDEFEIQLGDSQHRPFWALLSARLFDHMGEQASLTAVNVINERKRIEDELRASKETAELAYDRLHQAQNSLIQAEKMAALGSLVAGVAHEINTPIGTALTAASHLGERTGEFGAQFHGGKLKKSEVERYLETATETSAIMVATIGRAAELIQSFKQVAVDQSTDIRRQFNLSTYISEILLSLKPRLKQTHHSVVVDCPDDLEIDSYPGALSQVLTNFVMNSIIHGFAEGQVGTIAISAELRNDDLVEIRYGDSGRGIPEKNLARIFEPFFTTKRGTGGTGLGLHIVYNIVTQSLGGAIEVKSAEGQGATFILSIPRTAPGNVERWVDQ